MVESQSVPVAHPSTAVAEADGLHSRFAFYEGTYVAGDAEGAVPASEQLPHRAHEWKVNARASLDKDGLVITPAMGEPLHIPPSAIRATILNAKGVSKSSWGAERVLNVVWSLDGAYLCTVLVLMPSIGTVPSEWKRKLDELASRNATAPIPDAVAQRVKRGFFDKAALNRLFRYIFAGVALTNALIWGAIWAFS